MKAKRKPLTPAQLQQGADAIIKAITVTGSIDDPVFSSSMFDDIRTRIAMGGEYIPLRLNLADNPDVYKYNAISILNAVDFLAKLPAFLALPADTRNEALNIFGEITRALKPVAEQSGLIGLEAIRRPLDHEAMGRAPAFRKLGISVNDRLDRLANAMAGSLYAATDTSFTPSKDDMAILKYLSTARTAMTQMDIAENTHISRKTVGPRLTTLRNGGYVQHPTGSKRGEVITTKGRDLLPKDCPKITH